MSYSSRDDFTPFLYGYILFFFPHLIALDRSSSTVMTTGSVSGSSALYLIFEEKLSVFPIEYSAIYELYIYGLYCVEESSFYLFRQEFLS